MQYLLILLLILFSNIAFANSGASALGFPIVTSIFLFFIPLLIEYKYYQKCSISNPFKKSLTLNLSSTLVGNIIAGFALSTFVGHMLWIDLGDPHSPDKYWGVHLKVLTAFVFHYILTIVTEISMSKILKFDIPIKRYFIANLLSYTGLYSLVLISRLFAFLFNN